MTEKFCISIEISQDFIPKGPVDNLAALVQVIAWRRTGDKPLPEPRLTLIHWYIYAALGGDELIHNMHKACPAIRDWYTCINATQTHI